jgi:hypothetical protein
MSDMSDNHEEFNEDDTDSSIASDETVQNEIANASFNFGGLIYIF